ncbi:MAG: short-chain dehydrogenase [Proteobacteria bacterium]|nr:MAG: short-chain dehydrogenase [Pseudomonadota bacterium]
MSRSILITGASNGIGAALAQYYAAPHVKLGLIARNAERLQSVAKACEQKGAQVSLGLLDITDKAQLQRWIQAFNARFPIDLLIANAGISNQIGFQGETERLQDIEQLFAVNVHGVFHTIHPLLDHMRQRHSGQIALISSLAAYRGMPVTPAYSASKAAIKAYGEALRGYLKPEGIKVNIVCPGFVKSEMSDQFPGQRPFMLSPEKAAQIIAKGLANDRAIIAFPFPLNWGMWFLAWLPFPVASFFMGLSGYNRARPPQLDHHND